MGPISEADAHRLAADLHVRMWKIVATELGENGQLGPAREVYWIVPEANRQGEVRAAETYEEFESLDGVYNWLSGKHEH